MSIEERLDKIASTVGQIEQMVWRMRTGLNGGNKTTVDPPAAERHYEHSKEWKAKKNISDERRQQLQGRMKKVRAARWPKPPLAEERNQAIEKKEGFPS